LAFAAFAQQPDAPTLEAASLKPDNGDAASPGALRACFMRDPGLLECTQVNLKTLLAVAYGVKGNQIKGPAWIGDERYSLTARRRGATATSQPWVELQPFILERFGMRLHKETEPTPGYELTVAKGGPKMKEADAAEVAAANAAPLPVPGAGAAAGRRGATCDARRSGKLARQLRATRRSHGIAW
jgi:uncharacterized protein (TIGR03435 family)